MWPRLVALLAALLMIGSRLAHLRIVWIEEAYGMAAAAGIGGGKQLYSQIWFDKPPLYAWYYVLSNGAAGWPLRLSGIALVLATAFAIFLLARELWGEREGWLAAALYCFFVTFWIHSAVITVAPDALMVLPHTLAVLFAARKQPWISGVFAGIALLCNSKGFVVLAVSLLWAWPSVLPLLGSFFAVQALVLLIVPGADYWREVWVWGLGYSSDTFLRNPAREAAIRTLSWAGFHATLVVGAVICLLRERDHRVTVWFALSLASVIAGLRFFPRYYFALLPVATVAAARGVMLAGPVCRVALAALLLIPCLRFGPRYVTLALHGADKWSDVALMEDSKHAAAILSSASEARENSLLVWGYRPDVFVFSELPAGTRFLDSQPLSGVLADRHLFRSDVTFPSIGVRNRRELLRTRPTFIVDGLGLLNPSLAIDACSDLKSWLSQYERIGSTRASVVYRLRQASH